MNADISSHQPYRLFVSEADSATSNSVRKHVLTAIQDILQNLVEASANTSLIDLGFSMHLPKQAPQLPAHAAGQTQALGHVSNGDCTALFLHPFHHLACCQ